MQYKTDFVLGDHVVVGDGDENINGDGDNVDVDGDEKNNDEGENVVDDDGEGDENNKGEGANLDVVDDDVMAFQCLYVSQALPSHLITKHGAILSRTPTVSHSFT